MTAQESRPGWSVPRENSLAWPLALLVTLLLAQFALIFLKSFNWDEFLHYSMVYQLRDGTLARPFQTLLARILSWTPRVSDDLIAQMVSARMFIWTAFLVGVSALYGLARQFASREDALWTTLVYVAAGNVFVHGFAIRTDPIAMALLMSALYLLASRRLGWALVLLVGALVGFAGMLTVKSIFYAPCFAGIAWLRLSQSNNKRRTLILLAAVPPMAVVTFLGTYLIHRTGLAPVPEFHDGSGFLANGLQWLTDGLFRQSLHIVIAVFTAPVLVYALIAAPSAWRDSGASRARLIAFGGLCLPLVTIIFYRNVFPYFFVFLLAPVAVALAPAVAKLRKRYGTMLLAVAICAVPVAKFAYEPRDVLQRQEALISYVNSHIPTGTLSFDYCGMVADRPRVLDHLVSGLGLANYNRRGIPLIARAVHAGKLSFVIDNQPAIALALTGKTVATGLLPLDVQALHGNYVRAWGNLWLAGKEIPRGQDPLAINIPATGRYTANKEITIDGKARRRGEPFELSAGNHLVGGDRPERAVLWRGERLPAPPPSMPPGELFTNF